MSKVCGNCNRTHKKDPCPQCRTNKTSIEKGLLVSECQTCRVVKPVKSNKECSKCLFLKGLKECNGCGHIKSYHLDFNTNQSRCKICFNKARNHAGPVYISDVDRRRLLEEQDGKCAICFKSTKLVIDHDHKTGKIRGLLCKLCNSGLGMFYDSVSFLESAKFYLDRQKVEPKDRPQLKDTEFTNLMNRNEFLSKRYEEIVEKLKTQHPLQDKSILKVHLSSIHKLLDEKPTDNRRAKIQLYLEGLIQSLS